MDMISLLKITKGNFSAKNVGGVTLINLCGPVPPGGVEIGGCFALVAGG